MDEPRPCTKWREYDCRERGSYEYCQAAGKQCSCCGDRGQCTHPAELAAEAEARHEKER